MGIQLRKVASNEMFWEYNSAELPQKEYFENTIPKSCLEGNILRIQFCRIASKETFWEYNSIELP